MTHRHAASRAAAAALQQSEGHCDADDDRHHQEDDEAQDEGEEKVSSAQSLSRDSRQLDGKVFVRGVFVVQSRQERDAVLKRHIDLQGTG